VIVGMDKRSRLYLNKELLSSECTSFALHDKFLLYTTAANSLRFLSLHLPLPSTLPAGTLTQSI
jgi:elongator complex protein 1